MSICAGVVVSVPFHEVHNAPNTKARADGNNESLQNGNSLIEEFHSRFSPDCSIDKKTIPKEKQAGTSSVLPAPAILASPFIFIKNQPFGIAKNVEINRVNFLPRGLPGQAGEHTCFG